MKKRLTPGGGARPELGPTPLRLDCFSDIARIVNSHAGLVVTIA